MSLPAAHVAAPAASSPSPLGVSWGSSRFTTLDLLRSFLLPKGNVHGLGPAVWVSSCVFHLANHCIPVCSHFLLLLCPLVTQRHLDDQCQGLCTQRWIGNMWGSWSIPLDLAGNAFGIYGCRPCFSPVFFTLRQLKVFLASRG